MLVVGRFINGICVGITSSQVPVYLVEISKKEKRGSIVVIQQWAIEWGIFIMYFVGYGMFRLISNAVGFDDGLLFFYGGLLLPYSWAHAKHIRAEMLNSNNSPIPKSSMLLLRLELQIVCLLRI